MKVVRYGTAERKNKLSVNWEGLKNIEIKIYSSDGTKSSQRIMEDLNSAKTSDKSTGFYNAVDAVERGCGFSYLNNMDFIKETVKEKPDYFLQIMHEKNKCLDILVMLLYVPAQTKLSWVNTRKLNSPFLLCECLRQLVRENFRNDRDCLIIAKGMSELSEKDLEKFSYLLRRIMYIEKENRFLLSCLLNIMPAVAWEEMGNLISWNLTNKLNYFKACSDDVKWYEISDRTKPFLNKWFSYVEDCIQKKRFDPRLLNSVSDWIIRILIVKLDTIEKFETLLSNMISICEQKVNEWYLTKMQQSAVFNACLSVIYHLVFVLLNSCYKDCVDTVLIERMWRIINKHRCLWEQHNEINISVQTILSCFNVQIL